MSAFADSRQAEPAEEGGEPGHFGTTAVPNSIWDKPGALTRAEFDRVELHPMLTGQMLSRSPALAALNPTACSHHEKRDGSGYHKRVCGATCVP